MGEPGPAAIVIGDGDKSGTVGEYVNLVVFDGGEVSAASLFVGAMPI